MQIEAGKYYKTRDGRVVGPMVWHYDGFRGKGATCIQSPSCDQKYNEDGTVYEMRQGEENDQLVSLHYPETGTLQEIGAKVGDVVIDCYSVYPCTVTIIDNGDYYGVSMEGYIGLMVDSSTWTMLQRASESKPSPVREVTRITTHGTWSPKGQMPKSQYVYEIEFDIDHNGHPDWSTAKVKGK